MMNILISVREILKLHKVLAVAFSVTLLFCTFAYGADSIIERESESKQEPAQLMRAPEMPEYVLDVSDIVEVVVWRNEDLNRKVQIRPDGRISLPLAGEIKASGLTPKQLSDVIAATLERKYILDPQVTVIVEKIQSKTIMVLGHVNKPGLFNVDEKMTVLKAIAMAGGSSQFGHMESVLVVRNPYAMQPSIYTVDMQTAITKGKYVNDMALLPGDVVYVPKSFLGKIDDVMGFFSRNIQPTLSSYLQYRTLEAIEDDNN